MGYYYIKTDYLEHSSGPWKKHKYATKAKKNGKWVYTYPGGEVIGDVADKIDDAKEDVSKKVNKFKKEAKKQFSSIDGDDTVGKFKKELKKQFSPVDTTGYHEVGDGIYVRNGAKNVNKNHLYATDDDIPKKKKKKKKSQKKRTLSEIYSNSKGKSVTELGGGKTVTWD